jgi:hypothetical protein
LEAEFELQWADVKAGLVFVDQYIPGQRWKLIVGRVIPIGFLVVVGLTFYTSFIVRGKALSTFQQVNLGCLFAFVLLYQFRHWIFAYFILRKRRKTGFTKQRLTVTPQGFRLGVGDATPSSSPLIPWARVQQVSVINEKGFFLLPGKGTLVLPNRAFADKERFSELISLAQRYLAEAEKPKS